MTTPEIRDAVAREAPDVGRLRALIEAAHDRVGGISTERMGGDNLAVTLCSYFDDAEGEQDENGWTEAAVAGYEETVSAIRAHYRPVLDAFLDEVERLRAALEPFAIAIRPELPGDALIETVAWTADQHRAACSALERNPS